MPRRLSFSTVTLRREATGGAHLHSPLDLGVAELSVRFTNKSDLMAGLGMQHHHGMRFGNIREIGNDG